MNTKPTFHGDHVNRTGIKDIVKGGAPIVCLTAYTAPMARLLDPHVDVLLVGDSVGMVLYGFENTLPVTLDMMIAHGAAVVRSTSQALIVVDMPYGTYENSPDQALHNAKRVIEETGGMAVKLEGGQEMATTVAHLVKNHIPVLGHIGLLPQSVEKMGGFKIQGRDETSIERVVKDAQALAEAGVFAVVIEGTVETIARDITKLLTVPTIGIGASPACDGQILVIDDVLGLTQRPPRFSKKFADLRSLIDAAVGAYAREVRDHRFPGPEHCFKAK
jgi:3-methyl-2-oxobutanoate hydroxymethyltransferase